MLDSISIFPTSFTTPQPITLSTKAAARRLVLWSADSLLAFLYGCSFGIAITQANPIYAGEAISAVILVGYVASRKLEKTAARWRLMALLVMMALTAVGYVATDLIVQTPTMNYIRGWARLGVTIINMLAIICFIDPRIKRLDKVAAGFAVSSTVLAALGSGQFVWKFDGAIQLTIAAGALATSLPALPGSLLLLFAGVLNLSLDCRNAGGISIMVAALVFARLPRAARKKAGFLPIFLVGILLAGGLYLGYRLALNDYSERQAESNAGRTADIEVAVAEIAKSPIIGHGSWFYSADMQAAIAGQYADITGHHQSLDDIDISAGHSAVLQSWFEGGVFGALLFVMLIGKMIREIARQIFKDSSLPVSPLFVTLMAVACWDLMMSPFAGIHRTTIALGTASLFANQYGDRVLMAIATVKRSRFNTAKVLTRS